MKLFGTELGPLKIAGFLAGVLGLIVILGFCIYIGDLYVSLLALVGAMFGWLIGVLVAPFSATEERRFSEIGRVASSFITGYLLSKLDPVIGHMMTADGTGWPPIAQPPIAVQVLMFLISFLVALLFVFSARAYWADTDQDRAIDKWIEAQGDQKLTRADATRTLIERGLATSG